MTASRAPHASCTKLNFGPRLGIVGRVDGQDGGSRRLRPRLDRDGGHHDAVHDAGVSVPADRLAAHARQPRRRRSCSPSGPSVEPIPLTPDAGLGQGVFAVDRDLGSGYVQQWNASVQRELTPNISFEVAYVGSKITHVGLPDTNLNQLTVEQLALGRAAAAARAESVLRHHPALVVARRSDDPARAAAEAVSAVHDRQPLSQQRRHHDLSRRLREAGTALLARPVAIS